MPKLTRTTSRRPPSALNVFLVLFNCFQLHVAHQFVCSSPEFFSAGAHTDLCDRLSLTVSFSFHDRVHVSQNNFRVFVLCLRKINVCFFVFVDFSWTPRPATLKHSGKHPETLVTKPNPEFGIKQKNEFVTTSTTHLKIYGTRFWRSPGFRVQNRTSV